MTHDALITLIHARERQDGTALQVVAQPWAAPYLLMPGQTCQAKAETLKLLRALRHREEQHGLLPRLVSGRAQDGLWSGAQARLSVWLRRN
jgi:hypothetical protein